MAVVKYHGDFIGENEIGFIKKILLQNLEERGPLEGRRFYENVIKAYLKVSEHLDNFNLKFLRIWTILS